MFTTLPLYIIYILAFALSMVISAYAVKKIIFISRKRKIYDVPDDIRKIHGAEIPTLGGIGIFTGYLVVAAFFWPRQHNFMPYVLASSAILFFTGIYDDIMNMRPSKKLVAQLLASFITVWFAGIRIYSLFGFMGITEIPYWLSVSLTTLTCTFFINVFNFIDGIDGLAGTLAVLYLSLPGLFFALMQHQSVAGISFALAGATAGLLIYNIAPAKIYMGDTGSMFLGFTVFIFSVFFINCCSEPELSGIASYVHGPAQAMVLIVGMMFPLIFDAIRVFILRASHGVSPLKADRTHLHYYLLDAGCTHSQAVLVIVTLNIFTILLAWAMQDASPLLTLLGMTIISFIVLGVVYRMRQKRRAGTAAN